MQFNSHAWGRAPRRPRDFKFVFGLFLVDQSLRTKKLIPFNKSFKTYILFKFLKKLIELRKNEFLTGRFVKSAQKSNSSDRKNLK